MSGLARSPDLEIIAQREADEKDEDDRNEVLPEHPALISFRWNGQARSKAGTEKKFFDLRVNGERANERHGVAKRQHANRVAIFVCVGLASLVHQWREDRAITPVKEGYTQNEPYRRHDEVSAIIGEHPIKTHDDDPKPVN
jgi:hypothetical protein